VWPIHAATNDQTGDVLVTELEGRHLLSERKAQTLVKEINIQID
jgi:hypothetical protein